MTGNKWLRSELLFAAASLCAACYSPDDWHQPQTDPNAVDDFAYCICGRAFSAACMAKAQTRLGADLAMKLAENEESISICEICLATSPIAVHMACVHPSLLARGSLSAGLVSIRPLIVHDAYTAGFTDPERSHAAMRLAAEDRVAALAAAPAVTAAPTPKVLQTAKKSKTFRSALLQTTTKIKEKEQEMIGDKDADDDEGNGLAELQQAMALAVGVSEQPPHESRAAAARIHTV